METPDSDNNKNSAIRFSRIDVARQRMSCCQHVMCHVRDPSMVFSSSARFVHFDEIDPDQLCRHAALAVGTPRLIANSRTLATGFDVLTRSTAMRGSLLFNGPPLLNRR